MSQGPEGVQRGSRGGPDGVQMGSEGVQRGSRRVRTSLDGTVYEGCVGGLDRILPNSRGLVQPTFSPSVKHVTTGIRTVSELNMVAGRTCSC
eukprot:2843146-Pyramimonas_sp.AAC.1